MSHRSWIVMKSCSLTVLPPWLAPPRRVSALASSHRRFPRRRWPRFVACMIVHGCSAAIVLGRDRRCNRGQASTAYCLVDVDHGSAVGPRCDGECPQEQPDPDSGRSRGMRVRGTGPPRPLTSSPPCERRYGVTRTAGLGVASRTQGYQPCSDPSYRTASARPAGTDRMAPMDVRRCWPMASVIIRSVS